MWPLFFEANLGGVFKVATGMNNWSDHAEEDAVKKLKSSLWNRTDKLNLIVWRLSHDGQVSNSKPCWSCVTFLLRTMYNKIHWIWFSERDESTGACSFRRVKLSWLIQDQHPHLSHRRKSTTCSGSH